MTWQIVIEIGLTIGVVVLQWFYYNKSYQKIRDLEFLFPDYEFDPGYIEPQHQGDDEIPLLQDSENDFHPEFVSMVQTINRYLVNNHGNTDFASVKSIVDRKIENKENVINAGISLPLYIGLMGTFFGVCIGLGKIAFFGGVTDDNISAFIGGIFIAMIGSFCGLLFTVINNAHNYKTAKAQCDSRRNDFFNFLETDLFPHLGSGLFHALELLKTNIQEFNRTFKNNIDLFDTKFADNIKSLVLSVENISGDIEDVIENTKSQKEFLAELRNIGHLKMAETNLKAFTLLNKATPGLLEFIEKQKDLTTAVVRASEFVSLIESILNRVKSFENSLNNLGENINSKQYLGSEVLIRIDNNLNHLDKQFELLKRHEADTAESLEVYFKNQYQQVQRLTNDIKGEVEHALELKIDNNPLHKLQLLESIDKSLDLIKKSLEKRQEEENEISKKNTQEITPVPASLPHISNQNVNGYVKPSREDELNHISIESPKVEKEIVLVEKLVTGQSQPENIPVIEEERPSVRPAPEPVAPPPVVRDSASAHFPKEPVKEEKGGFRRFVKNIFK